MHLYLEYRAARYNGTGSLVEHSNYSYFISDWTDTIAANVQTCVNGTELSNSTIEFPDNFLNCDNSVQLWVDTIILNSSLGKEITFLSSQSYFNFIIYEDNLLWESSLSPISSFESYNMNDSAAIYPWSRSSMDLWYDSHTGMLLESFEQVWNLASDELDYTREIELAGHNFAQFTSFDLILPTTLLNWSDSILILVSGALVVGIAAEVIIILYQFKRRQQSMK